MFGVVVCVYMCLIDVGVVYVIFFCIVFFGV